MSHANVVNLIERSKWLRNEVFELVVRAKKGHAPSSFSCAEVVLGLFYGGYLKYDAKNPHNPDRDRLIISKGHAAMVLYPILADLGFFPKSELEKFTTKDALLRMYADHMIPGIESVTGSLGHGFGIGCGHAFAGKKDKKDFKTYVVIGDGECYEGSIWETAMFASHYKLDNFVTIVDRNRLCIMDETENCVQLDPLDKKWEAFGWKVKVINGHRYAEVLEALKEAKENNSGKPMAIIANTVKGKGISFMEGRSDWHNKMPNDAQIAQAREALKVNCIVD